jgi:hypothetical protein
MSPSLVEYYLMIASLVPSTTYGYGEKMCGDIGKPVACSVGAVTASGVPFNPAVPMVALAMPTNRRLVARHVWLRVEGGECKRVRLTDKMNPRYIGKRGFDLTPAAVTLLTGKPATKHWSGRVEVCKA